MIHSTQQLHTIFVVTYKFVHYYDTIIKGWQYAKSQNVFGEYNKQEDMR